MILIFEFIALQQVFFNLNDFTVFCWHLFAGNFYILFQYRLK